MALQNLSAGVEIDILWNVELEGENKDVWWRARIKQLVIAEAKSGPKTTALIQYEPMHGFDEASSEVIFLGSDKLLTVDRNTRHQWHLSEPPVASAEEDLSDNEKHSARQEEITPLRAKYAGLALRVANLERHISAAQGNTVVRQHLAAGFSEAGALQPLQFAREKLGAFWDAAPMHAPSPQPARTHALSQTLIARTATVTADCTLAEFERIALKIRQQFQSGVCFTPPFECTQAPTARSKQFQVLFDSYHDVCKALDISSVPDIEDTLIKKKNKKGKPATQIRLVGTLLRDSSNPNSPVQIALGSSKPPLIEKDAKICVIVRNSQEWDPINDIFCEPLQSRIDKASTLHTTGSDDGDVTKSHMFIKWTRLYQNESTGTFVAAPMRTVVGTLEVNTPYIVATGTELCDEITHCVAEEGLTKKVLQMK